MVKGEQGAKVGGAGGEQRAMSVEGPVSELKANVGDARDSFVELRRDGGEGGEVHLQPGDARLRVRVGVGVRVGVRERGEAERKVKDGFEGVGKH